MDHIEFSCNHVYVTTMEIAVVIITEQRRKLPIDTFWGSLGNFLRVALEFRGRGVASMLKAKMYNSNDIQIFHFHYIREGSPRVLPS